MIIKSYKQQAMMASLLVLGVFASTAWAFQSKAIDKHKSSVHCNAQNWQYLLGYSQKSLSNIHLPSGTRFIDEQSPMNTAINSRNSSQNAYSEQESQMIVKFNTQNQIVEISCSKPS